MAVSKDKQLEHLIAENERLKNQSRLLNAILDNAPILISAKDLEGNILFTNKHFAVLDGPSPEEYINQSVFELFPKDIAEQLWQNDLKAQRSAEPIQAEETVQHRDGKAHVYHTTKFRLLDASESLIGTCAVSFDISRKKQLEQEVLHDFLTGIYNQRYIEENFSRDLARAQRLNKELMVAFIDIDDFKQVNDRFGHDKGNQILKAVAETLQSQMHRPDDVAFRFGGDEFGILLLAEDKEISVKLVE